MIERDGRSMSMGAPEDWALTYYAYPMVDKRRAEQGLSDASLVLKIFLDTAELGILCAVQTDRNTPDKYRMTESDASDWCSSFGDDDFGELPFLEGAPVQEGDTLVDWGEGWLAAYQRYPLSDFQERSSVEMIATVC
jgi:hypothetical protein